MRRSAVVTIRCGCGTMHKFLPGAPRYDALWGNTALPPGLFKSETKRRTWVADHVDARAGRLTKRLATLFKRIARELAADVRKEMDRRALQSVTGHKITRVTLAKEDLADAVLRELTIEGYDDEVVRAVRPLIEESFRDAALYGLDQVGVEITADNKKELFQEATDFAEARAAELVGKKVVAGVLVDNPNSEWSITATTRSQLRDLITSAIEDGESSQALADAIQDSFGFSEARAEMIARTEMAFSAVEGNLEGWRQSGVVEKKRVILGDNHDFEDECDDSVDEGAIPIDDDFDAGDGPPFHPNCVCALIPVLAEQGEDEDS